MVVLDRRQMSVEQQNSALAPAVYQKQAAGSGHPREHFCPTHFKSRKLMRQNPGRDVITAEDNHLS